jgi:hypothetical protein
MGAVGNLELAEDAGDVIADRLWTEYQPTSDLGVTQAASDQPQNFALAIGQLRERYGRPLPWRREEGRQAARDRRPKERLAACDGSYGPEQFRLIGAFEYVASLRNSSIRTSRSHCLSCKPGWVTAHHKARSITRGPLQPDSPKRTLMPAISPATCVRSRC